MEAIRNASRILGNERLAGCSMVVTLEPCMMCTGAAVLARLEQVYYFARVESGLGMEDVLGITGSRPKGINHRPLMVPVPELRDDARTLLCEFFRQRRRKSPSKLANAPDTQRDRDLSC
jgi:tRNA(adenine34) deaminase